MQASRSSYPCVLTDVLVALAGSVFMIYTGTVGYQAIQWAKYAAFRVLFGGYFLLMGVLLLDAVVVCRAKLPTPWALWRKASFVQRAVVVYWAWSVLSTLASPYRGQALIGMSRYEGLLTITIYCGLFLCVSVFARPQPWMLYLFGATMSVFCVICLLQMAGYNPLSLYPEGYSYFDANIKYVGIYLGTIGNADLVAALLCVAIPVFWITPLRSRERERWTLLLPLALCLVTLVRMDVQAGLLAVVVGSLLSVPVALPVPAKYRKYLWGTVAAVFLLGVVVVWNSPRTWGTVYELREVLHGNWDDSFGSWRIAIWKRVLSQVPQRLWLGTGPDTMIAANISVYTYHDAQTGASVPFIVDVAHNEYLNILYHQGLPALLAYLAALLGSAVRWIRRGGESAAVAALGGAVLCYCAQAFFGFSMCQTASVFYVAWGLLENTCNHREDTQARKTLSKKHGR